MHLTNKNFISKAHDINKYILIQEIRIQNTGTKFDIIDRHSFILEYLYKLLCLKYINHLIIWFNHDDKLAISIVCRDNIIFVCFIGISHQLSVEFTYNKNLNVKLKYIQVRLDKIIELFGSIMSWDNEHQWWDYSFTGTCHKYVRIN